MNSTVEYIATFVATHTNIQQIPTESKQWLNLFVVSYFKIKEYEDFYFHVYQDKKGYWHTDLDTKSNYLNKTTAIFFGIIKYFYQ